MRERFKITNGFIFQMFVSAGRGMKGQHSRHEPDVAEITGYGAMTADGVLFCEPDEKPLLFEGSPSQVINLPNVFYGLIVLACVGAIDLYASKFIALDPYVLCAQVAAIVAAVAMSFAKTFRTKIWIDAEKIYWEQGVFKRVLFSTELAAARNVWVIQPWWQRPFGVGMVMIGVDEPRKRVRRLPGIHGFEALCEQIRAAAVVAGREQQTVRRPGLPAVSAPKIPEPTTRGRR